MITHICPLCGDEHIPLQHPPFVQKESYREYCDQCDGVGWYEGGKTLMTTCEKCNGYGWADGKP